MNAKKISILSLVVVVFSLFQVGCGGSSDSNDKPAPDAAADVNNQPKADAASDAAVVTTHLRALGIGVADVAKSKDFYTRVLGMTVKKEYKLDNREEVELEFTGSKGANVVLMNFTDGVQRDFKNKPDKLVFYVPDATKFAQGFKDAKLEILREVSAYPTNPDIIVGMARDLDGYMIEIVQDKTTTIPYLGAGGIGVTDLQVSTDFYINVIGMALDYYLPVTGLMNENILKFEGVKSSGVVMMFFTDGVTRNYKDLPYKLSYNVPKVSEMIDKIRNAKMEIVAEPSAMASMGNLMVGYAKDPDGYLLEFVEIAQ